jgi:hypothetical protein
MFTNLEGCISALDQNLPDVAAMAEELEVGRHSGKGKA